MSQRSNPRNRKIQAKQRRDYRPPRQYGDFPGNPPRQIQPIGNLVQVLVRIQRVASQVTLLLVSQQVVVGVRLDWQQVCASVARQHRLELECIHTPLPAHQLSSLPGKPAMFQVVQPHGGHGQ